jgi:hypothetical protein
MMLGDFVDLGMIIDCADDENFGRAPGLCIFCNGVAVWENTILGKALRLLLEIALDLHSEQMNIRFGSIPLWNCEWMQQKE